MKWIAKGVVKLYLKNKNEVWPFVELSPPFGKRFKVDKKILVLPGSTILVDGTKNRTAMTSGVANAPPVNITATGLSNDFTNPKPTGVVGTISAINAKEYCCPSL